MSNVNPPNSSRLAWLKDSEGVWNYARITGFVMLMIFQPAILVYVFVQHLVPDINNLYQWLILCIPSIVSVILFLIDFFRDKNSLRVHFGAVELEYDKHEDNNSDTKVPEE